MHATYLGANGWLLEIGGLRVLVDPWLTGSLVFPPGPWLLRGELPHPWPVPERLDLLLLTQGLADHCHPPSLDLLDRHLPVVGSATAAARARQLGFQQVTALRPGQQLTWPDGAQQLQITATRGAPVPQVENGYLLRHPAGRLYLEPHGFCDPTLPAEPLDAVITPVVDLGLPLAGAFVKGQQVLPQLVERFSPRTVLASSAGGDVRFTGALVGLLQTAGSTETAAAQLTAPGQRLLDPVPGERYCLRPPSAATQR